MSLIIYGAIGLYIYGGYKFWKGFRHTHYSSSISNKVKLTLLWPAFYVYSRTYRQNFNRTLKGD